MKEHSKICLITECSSGIGKATAIEMARMNYSVIMLARDSDKSRKALADIKSESLSEDIKMFYVVAIRYELSLLFF